MKIDAAEVVFWIGLVAIIALYVPPQWLVDAENERAK